MAAKALDIPIVMHLFPMLFLVLGMLVALPQAIFHVLTSPTEYLFTSEPAAARWSKFQKKFFYFAWRVFSPLLDPGEAYIKRPLIGRAYGAVLEIGAGVGDNIKYYNRPLVSRLILVEPNTNMHPALRAKANAAGFHESDGSLLLLGCGGAQSDERALELAGVGPATIDTVVSIHVLCGIPGPAQAIEMYRRQLKPGGLLVFFEHVRSEEKGTAKWQNWYTTIWKNAFDGCEMNRPTGWWIANGPDGAPEAGASGTDAFPAAGARRRKGGGMANGDAAGRWKSLEIAAPEEQPMYTCIPHVKGYAIKA